MGIKVFNSHEHQTPSILFSDKLSNDFRNSIGDSFWKSQITVLTTDWWRTYCDNPMFISKPSSPFQWELMFTVPSFQIVSSTPNPGISVNEVNFFFYNFNLSI